MKISLAQKFRLYPDKEQAERLQHYANVCRLYYNLCLNQRNMAKTEGPLPNLLGIFELRQNIEIPKKQEEIDYEEERKKPIFHKITYQSKREDMVCQNRQIKLLNEIKWIADVPFSCRQEAVRNLHTAFHNFFRRVKQGQTVVGSKKNPFGYPTFKSRNRHNSISFKPNQVKIVSPSKAAGGVHYDGLMKIPKFDSLVKIRQDRPLEGKVLGSTISLKNRKWYVSFTIEQEIDDPIPKIGKIGIDRGITHFIALSNGEFIDHGSPWKLLDKKIKKLQRKVAKQVKFSGRWRDTMQKISRLKEKQMNQRQDFLHKASNDLTNRFGIIAVEDLKISNMSATARGTVEEPGKNVKAKAGLNRSILEQSWGEFGRQLEYKSNWKGGRLVKVNPKHTSQTCSVCGYKDKNNRTSQSKFKCLKCGFEENADLNASKNILKRAV